MSSKLDVITLLLTDTEAHFLNSAYMIGDLSERGNNVKVVCYAKGEAKKRAEEVLALLKIKDVTFSDDERHPKIKDKLENAVDYAHKEKSHFIYFPYTHDDVNNDPINLAAFQNFEAYDICRAKTEEQVEKRLKGVEGESKIKQSFKLQDELKVTPVFHYTISTDESIYNTRKKYGLEKLFKK